MPWLSWLDSKKTSQPCQINLVTWQQFKWVECVLLWALGKTWDQSNNTFSLLFLPGSHQLLHGPDWGLHQPQHEWGELPALWAQHWRYRLKHGCRDFQQPCRGTAHPKHAQSDSPAAFQWLLPVHHPYWSHGGSSDMCLLRILDPCETGLWNNACLVQAHLSRVSLWIWWQHQSITVEQCPEDISHCLNPLCNFNSYMFCYLQWWEIMNMFGQCLCVFQIGLKTTKSTLHWEKTTAHLSALQIYGIKNCKKISTNSIHTENKKMEDTQSFYFPRH